MRTLAALFVFAALAFVGRGETGRQAREPRGATASQASPLLYEANATVLQSKQHGPMLCLGAVLTSLPPQCGDVPLEGWDWDAVEGETKTSGTTWGDFHVTGSYANGSFTVVAVGPYVREAEPETDLSSPCPTPAGGWSGLENATQEDDGAISAYARRQPDYVTSWVTHIDPEAAERSPVIVNVVFTGDAARHEFEIRKVWAGPLCVIAEPGPSAAELSHIRREAESALREMGLSMLWSEGPGVEPVIEIGVVVDPSGQAQAAFDERFGAGRVRLIPALKPA